MPEAFFIRDGDRYLPTELTRGPWDPNAQHGGPPAALLGTLLERCERREDSMVVRLTFEILKPVPLTPLAVETRMLRPGRSVQVLGGSLFASGEEVVRAHAVRIRTADVAVPEPPPDAPPGPEKGKTPRFFPSGQQIGWHTAMEASFVRGNFTEPGPGTAWLRMRYPLIAGEPVAPLARVLMVADAGNGVSAVLDYRRFLFINPDLTVYLHRYPLGEWVCIEAETTPTPRGVGLAASALYDRQGPLGRGLQSLFIAERQ
ncbi:MAG TPA: thioesterase family protein [Myxococcales bacterium]|nr:thioesterase family protein [Myxococcales bacterium]